VYYKFICKMGLLFVGAEIVGDKFKENERKRGGW
jgi:hypothetical protein